MADLKAFAEQLVNLTVKEVSELTTILKEQMWSGTVAHAYNPSTLGGQVVNWY